MQRQLLPEFIGTSWLVFGGCGSTVLPAASCYAALTLIQLISIPVTNTSVNPARNTAPALFAGGAYIGQFWLFRVAQIVGAMIAGIVGLMLYEQAEINESIVTGKLQSAS